MANDIRVRQGFLGGTITDNPLTSGATTFNSAALASLVAIGTTEHAAITLDPDGVGGAPEVVIVTAHTASATSATVLRGQEGTTARAHNLSTACVHSPTVRDFDYTQCRLTRAATQSVSSATVTAISWDTEVSDPVGWITVPGTTLTCPADEAGLYQIQVIASYSSAATTRGFIDITVTRSGTPVTFRTTMTGDDLGSCACTTPMLPSDTFVVNLYQQSGSSRTITARLDVFKIGRLKY